MRVQDFFVRFLQWRSCRDLMLASDVSRRKEKKLEIKSYVPIVSARNIKTKNATLSHPVEFVELVITPVSISVLLSPTILQRCDDGQRSPLSNDSFKFQCV
jgi:hypothetical protein